jgi:hypothetical protein
MTENDDVVILWEAPKIVPPEFRLYYDEKGKVICYTCEKLDGNYIIIDALTYAEGRPDIRVIDGKIVKVATNVVITKLVPDTNEGKWCVKEDVSIITDSSYKGEKTKWKLNLYEL